ncbi:hypothetical protein [Paracoccus sp. (in: a-proteobacteria)]|uniref:calcium-binding protein n=1 Tax=Paracoccus sp. TaxID=267 RepID=UPI002897E492|nr:hypothetical protein [Paracoccus sp. (in: a-proteobacteria)]
MPTARNDVIRGPYNGRTIDALGGDDQIYWGRGDGNATIFGGNDGESYDPNYYTPGNPGGDRLHINGSVGATIRFTATEDGTVTIGNQVLTFRGIERLYGTGGADVISAADARLTPAHGNTPAHGVSIYGGGGKDHITGSAWDDVIDGGSSNDTIYGGAGDDFIQSSTGHDLIYGGTGNENIRWGLGDNVAPGNDTIYGGEGGEGIGDLINIWSVNANGTTGARVTFTTAESGVATTTMGGVTSTLHFYEFENGWTHRANDVVTAANASIGANNVGIRFNTRWGNDQLTGSRGNDTLEGGEGRDTITGGRGNDLISANGEYYNRNAPGDGHVDTLIFRAGDGHDTVVGFDAGIDILDVGGRNYTAVERSDGTMLTFAGGDTILLANEFDFI